MSNEPSALDRRAQYHAEKSAGQDPRSQMRAFVESLPPATDANRGEIEKRVAALPPEQRAQFDGVVKEIAVERGIVKPADWDRYSALEKRAWQDHHNRRGRR